MAQRVKRRHLKIHNDVRRLSELSGFVEAVAAEKDLDKSLVLALSLALEEAVTNVMNYAYPTGQDGDITIEAAVTKMMYLLGCYPDNKAHVRERLSQSLRGEMSE